MEALKKIGFFLLKFLLVILIIIILVIIGLFIYYLITIQSFQEYLPSNFILYAEVESIKEIYDNVIDLKAADILFSSPDLKSIYSSILEFKSNELSKNYIFKNLLEVEAGILIDENYKPMIVFDLGILSLATRMLPLINLIYRIDNLDLTIIQKGQLTIYNFTPSPEQSFYLSVANNLVFLSTEEENIVKLFENYETGNNLKNNADILNISEKVRQKGFIKLYLNTNSFVNEAFKNDDDIFSILRTLDFNSLSALAFQISNENLKLSGYTKIRTNNNQLNAFLDYKPVSLEVLKYLPSSTNIYFTLNFKSFKELFQVILTMQGEDFEKSLDEINDLSSKLLHMTLDDLLDWIGSEIGFYTVEESEEPVIFIEIIDRTKLDTVLENLVDSIVFKQGSDLVIDNVRLNQIRFPGLIQRIANRFIKGIDTPFFMIKDNFIFFSMHPENLANLENNYKGGKVLVSSKNYKELTQPIPKNANLFMYYDLSTAIPKLISGNNIVGKLLGLYETGLIAFNFSNTEISLDISASGIASAKTIPFPGFPHEIKDSISNNSIIVEDIRGNSLVELIYIDGQNNLVIEDIITGEKSIAPVEKNSSIVIMHDNNEKWIFVYSNSGTIFKFDVNAVLQDPFPLITGFKNSFMPIETEGQLLIYSAIDSALVLLSEEGTENKIELDISNQILAQPNYRNGVLAFYPKTFSGTVFLSDMEGNILKGWPQDGASVSYCSPIFYSDNEDYNYIVFLTQSGKLCVWNMDGEAVNNFPIQLEGVYYTEPSAYSINSYSNRGILALDEKGLLTLTGLDGTILKQKYIEGADNKDNRLIVFDFDSDGVDEIFIYGGSNFINGLNNKFVTLPGFPVKGSMKPYFTDLNYDGIYEMIAASFDKNIYAYSLNK